MSRHSLLTVCLLALLVTIGGTMIGMVATLPPASVEIAGYATSLAGRTPRQRHNARLAAASLNNRTIAPYGTFSFNKTVQSWSMDAGYVKAPVSFDGELIPAFGGGVCQTSTTLYNAALIAGLTIVERHAHVFAPHYVAPGRDAAVAHPNIDLRLRNPYPFPLRVRAGIVGDRLEVRLFAPRHPNVTVQIQTSVLATRLPERLTVALPVSRSSQGAEGSEYLRGAGATGFRVVTYRTIQQPGQATRRERLSDNAYPAMNRVVLLRGEEQSGR